MSETSTTTALIADTTDIVSAFVANNHVSLTELPALIATVHGALVDLAVGRAAPVDEPTEHATPAQIRKSITPDALISFIDGKGYKVLKRHLTLHGLDPASYRARFGLPGDYPMTAPSYSVRRSELARGAGLGLHGRQDAEPALEGARRQDQQAAE